MLDKRIQILSQAEIKAIYDYPAFLPEEQFCFFDTDEKTITAIKKLQTTESKIYFILMLGYFKAKSIFYKIDYEKSREDIIYIIDRFLLKEKPPIKHPSTKVITKIKILIKNYFHIDESLQQEKKIDKKLSALLQNNTIPTNLLKELLNYFYNKNIPIPGYTTLQSLIGKAIKREENRLMRLIARHMTKRIDNLIDKLLTLENGIYYISALKADPKSFKTHDIQEELEKHMLSRKIFTFAKKLLPKLNISMVNINYYASLAIYYDAHRLNNFPKRKCQLYLVCFVHNQFYKINNNVIDAFIHYVRGYDKKAEEDAVNNIAKSKLAIHDHQQKMGNILELFDGSQLDEYKFKFVKKKAFKTMPLEEMRNVRQLFKKGVLDKKEFIWQFHSTNHQTTTLNLRPLFMEINFECSKNSTHLKKAMHFMRSTFKSKKLLAQFKIADIPTEFIDEKIKRYLIVMRSLKRSKRKSKQIEPYRYEYLVYQKLERGLQAGTTFSNDSIEYKSLESDLQLKEKLKDYEKFIRQSEIPVIKNDIQETLCELKATLEPLIERINQRIMKGENKAVKIKGTGDKAKITLSYEKLKEEFNDPFFDDHEQINIVDLLVFVDKLCQYSKEFLHLKEYQSKKESDYEYLFACILADATGLGIHKISESSHLNYDKLKRVHQSRIRLETLKRANKIICDKMAELPIFKHYNLGGKTHGSDDGQKFDVKWETFKSRYLRKYFKEKGVSAYSMVINNISVDSLIITGHESHYLFDIVFNNTTNIRPDIISTDTEGANQVNFSFLDLISVAFAPCYKSVGKKIKTIYGFNHPKYYKNKGYIIKPVKKANEKLIVREWPNILNIFAAALSGDNSQSTIVRKLSSHERNSDTKNALWEYNKILMSIYLLIYIDDPEFRRNVRTSLNRGEGFHQARRAIANVGGGDFRGKNEMEIIVWNECARLVANAIIYYNAYVLSNILEAKEKASDKEAIELLKRISPIAWQHINLLGMYDFSLKGAIDIERLLSAMLKNFDEEWSKMKKSNEKKV